MHKIDIDLLPQSLKEKSLSSTEVVLRCEDILTAIDLIIAQQRATIGWEIWFLYPQGQISGIIEIDGESELYTTVDVMKRKMFESWKQYVKRTSEKAKEEIIRTNFEVNEKCNKNGVIPYFCITTINHF
ncbi:MAG: hypothetical protein NAG76_18575 [Candidatus Pristimantibacillus lignocellulolyticus]|uniref:Uncharacterized protein n=1 Tax=Candidatus Pristimantibacillus lignocellulolyticus TaxID=2994561 RepID=A0A9J6ZCI0_9BACL|nr:MAG: hypothetical protein NAG76_18575 [Candidatus Pristimantibacillus lignocellulolyticus]